MVTPGGELACVISNGGPLIALPRELTAAWRGVLAPLGVEVPPGWTSEDGGVVSDYDRGCDPPDRRFVIDDSFSTWPVSVGDGTALVLDEQWSTSAVRWDDGLVIIRDVGGASEAEVVAMIEAVAAQDWVNCGLDLTLEQGLAIFDSAYGGFERDQADGGALDADLVPGTYRVHISYPRREGRTTLVRLVGPAQGSSRGMSGIVVR